MRKLLFAGSALMACALAQAQMDNADSLSQSALGFGFRLGGYFPAESQLRDQNATWIDFGIEYEFEKSFMREGSTYLALDYVSPKLFGEDRLLALTVNQRFYTGGQRYGGSAYFFAGVGFGTISGGDSGVIFRGGIGTELSSNAFLEASAFLGPDLGGINPSGIGLSIGYRFK